MKKSQNIPIGIVYSMADFLVATYINSTERGEGLSDYLKSVGAVISNDHFVYTKGGHGDAYVNIKGLNIFQLITVAMQMAYEMHISGFKADAVVAVPHGADVLASLVALFYSLFSGEEVRNLKLMKKGDNDFAWYKDNGDYAKDARLVLVEDVINTGKSLVRCGNFVRNSGVKDLACRVVCDRLSDKNPGLPVLGKEFQADDTGALLSIEAVNYDVPEGTDPRGYCPFCAEGRKINTIIGHGKEFILKMKDSFPAFYAWITSGPNK